jgi:hypothetical protein
LQIREPHLVHSRIDPAPGVHNSTPAWLSPRYMTNAHHPRAFQYFKLGADGKRIVTNPQFVGKADGCIRAVSRLNPIVWAVNELDAQHLAVAPSNTKVRSIVSCIIT